MSINGPMTIRWRAIASGGQGATSWTLVHRSLSGQHDSDAKTLCGLKIPDMPYLEDIGTQIPDGAPRCKRCERLAS